MPSTLEINSGNGSIQIDAQEGTLYVVYYCGDPAANVLYANDGGMPSTPLPLGESWYEVPVNSFQISYDMGSCPGAKLSWWYQ